jgi:hypothetical protein
MMSVQLSGSHADEDCPSDRSVFCSGVDDLADAVAVLLVSSCAGRGLGDGDGVTIWIVRTQRYTTMTWGRHERMAVRGRHKIVRTQRYDNGEGRHKRMAVRGRHKDYPYTALYDNDVETSRAHGGTGSP